MSRRIGKLIDDHVRQNEEAKQPPKYLCTIPDSVTLTRQVFVQYLRKYPKAKKFGFSKAHTAQIAQLRQQNGATHYPDKIYDLPVAWNTDVTYIV